MFFRCEYVSLRDRIGFLYTLLRILLYTSFPSFSPYTVPDFLYLSFLSYPIRCLSVFSFVFYTVRFSFRFLYLLLPDYYFLPLACNMGQQFNCGEVRIWDGRREERCFILFYPLFLFPLLFLLRVTDDVLWLLYFRCFNERL